MAYNNQFQGYQPSYYYPQYQPQAQNPAPSTSNSIIWVQGEAGAKSYLVAPNSTVQLWDSEAQVIYLKSADSAGMPSMKIIDYTIRDMQPSQPIITEEFATKDDLAELKKQIDALSKKITKTTAKEVKANE